MKTYGICGKQSARKHRQRGDYVIYLRGFPGRYTWLHRDTLSPADEKVNASQVRQRQRAMLYNDELAQAVTASGQLSLLMLIERLELAGIPVVSANTDGVVILDGGVP